MESSKDLFLMMREQEVNTTRFLPTKEELTQSSKDFAYDLVNSGEYNLQELYSQALRLKESLTAIEGILKTKLPQENFEAFGLKGTYRSGGDTINYKDDDIYCELMEKVDFRKELLKTALLSDINSLYDDEGVEVPKVSKTPRKSSLAISF